MKTDRFSPADQQTITEPDSSRRRASRESLPLLVHFGFRPITQAINPLVLAVAGRKHMGLVAKLSHYGRLSGRRYVTPVGARLIGEQIWIPLTFGIGSDWCRNILATGTCEVKLKGVSYALSNPKIVSAGDALPAVSASFSPIQLFILRLIGVKAFVRLDLAPKVA